MAGCKIGAFLSTGDGARAKLNHWQKNTGTVPKIVCNFYSLNQKIHVNSDEMQLFEKHEIIHLMKIEPWDGLKPILNGEKSKIIEGLASDLKGYAGEVRMTLGHEMNVSANCWYPWQGASADYINAVNYFAEKIYKCGANNVKLVYNVNVHDPNLIEAFYPGDESISYLAVDGYNWGPTQSWGSKWQEFDEIFGQPLRILRELSPEKPIMIGEFASTEIGGDKAKWIINALNGIRNNNIESFIWFDIKKELDWRVDSSPQSIKAIKDILCDPYYIRGLNMADGKAAAERSGPKSPVTNPVSRIMNIKKAGPIGDDGVSIAVKVKVYIELPEEVKSLKAAIITNQEWPAGFAGAPENGKGEVEFFCYLHPSNQVTPFIIRGFDKNRNQIYESNELCLEFPD